MPEVALPTFTRPERKCQERYVHKNLLIDTCTEVRARIQAAAIWLNYALEYVDLNAQKHWKKKSSGEFLAALVSIQWIWLMEQMQHLSMDEARKETENPVIARSKVIYGFM